MMKGNFDRFESFDEYALRIARRIVAVDQHRLKGGKVQYQAIIQDAIVDAMREAVSERKPAMPVQDRDSLALAAMSDEQAAASLDRFNVMRKQYVAAVLELPR
ncbi:MULTISPECIES: hypothetical protein [unclassified Caballeronia]|uniref:hypothetical protein n=1 Tax=unclassified Caballeronia TaxID=2646786 RepID=UPI001F260C08|nr:MULTISPECIES: hypothetical protein [unclassified Caballeronia]MCE4544611.1 hypothetical protein [Caballeronia sp. PC1]MCE4571763.1 hypothetical protein [Caballeronia sp. CLC5]